MTIVRCTYAARAFGYNSRYIAELKNLGHIEDPGHGQCYLEQVRQWRESHPVTPGWALPDRTPCLRGHKTPQPQY